VAASVSNLTHLGEDTRLPDVFNEAQMQLTGVRGDTAIVLFSDGLPTVASREQPASHTLAAARQLLEAQSGRVCFHSVQVGDDPAGARLLQQLAQLTPCGSTRSAASIDNGSNLLIAQRTIFLGESLPTVAAAPGDADRDGVADNSDRCPRTPIGAEVDPRGCWVLTGLHFAHDSDSIGSRSTDDLNGVANVLRSNAKLRIRIDGYTDSSGAESYNQALSERRARAVQSYLESAGIDGDRLDARGHGETMPIADNATAEGRAQNRRSELIRVD
jgi:OOP family OmpA-OmpF porin